MGWSCCPPQFWCESQGDHVGCWVSASWEAAWPAFLLPSLPSSVDNRHYYGRGGKQREGRGTGPKTECMTISHPPAAARGLYTPSTPWVFCPGRWLSLSPPPPFSLLPNLRIMPLWVLVTEPKGEVFIFISFYVILPSAVFPPTLLLSLSLWDFSGTDCVCKICVCIMSVSCGLLFGTPSPAVVLHGRHVQTWVLFSLCPPDVYSFQEEGPVLDPHLAKHLAHFGIDMLHTNGVRTSFVSNSNAVSVVGVGGYL